MGILSSLFSVSRYTLISRIFIIFLILPLHEFAHGWVAKKCGDDTADLSGRLSINPIAHLDPIGSVLLLLTGFGWAKPVPINPNRMKHPRRDIALTALAGPVSNLIAALVGIIALQIIICFNASTNVVLEALYQFFCSFSAINIYLAVFNLIPLPPLDGSKVLMYFLPYKANMWIMRNQRYLNLALWILILCGVTGIVIGWLGNWVFTGLVYATNWIHILIAMVI